MGEGSKVFLVYLSYLLFAFEMGGIGDPSLEERETWYLVRSR